MGKSNDRAFAPILVVDFGTVLGSDRGHCGFLSAVVTSSVACELARTLSGTPAVETLMAAAIASPPVRKFRRDTEPCASSLGSTIAKPPRLSGPVRLPVSLQDEPRSVFVTADGIRRSDRELQ